MISFADVRSFMYTNASLLGAMYRDECEKPFFEKALRLILVDEIKTHCSDHIMAFFENIPTNNSKYFTKFINSLERRRMECWNTGMLPEKTLKKGHELIRFVNGNLRMGDNDTRNIRVPCSLAVSFQRVIV